MGLKIKHTFSLPALTKASHVIFITWCAFIKFYDATLKHDFVNVVFCYRRYTFL